MTGLDAEEFRQETDLTHRGFAGAPEGVRTAVREGVIHVRRSVGSIPPPSDEVLTRHRTHTPGGRESETDTHLALKIRGAKWLATRGYDVPTASGETGEYFDCFEVGTWFGRVDVAPSSRAVYVEAGGTRYDKLLKAFGLAYDPWDRELRVRGLGSPPLAEKLILIPYVAQEPTHGDELITIVLTPGDAHPASV